MSCATLNLVGAAASLPKLYSNTRGGISSPKPFFSFAQPNGSRLPSGGGVFTSLTSRAYNLRPCVALCGRNSAVAGEEEEERVTVLVVGGGGREHALCYALKRSPTCDAVFCAPGNVGISSSGAATCIPDLDVFDSAAVISFCRKWGVGLVVVGPEAPLVAGLVNDLVKAGIYAFGPSSEAAALEGSKNFMKSLCDKYGIPTAKYRTFTDPSAAKEYIKEQGVPIVVKADGLAAGKGVIVAMTLDEALEAVDSMLVNDAFGSAGCRVVIEEYLEGEEVSFFALVDGENAIPLESAQDHKRVGDGDTGPNTGGMGAYSPAPILTKELQDVVMKSIIFPTVKGMSAEGCKFVGVLYAGLMIEKKSGLPKLIEYNVRFGDPECQVLMVRLESDLARILLAACKGQLSEVSLEWSAGSAMVVVMASKGYPGPYETGSVIANLDEAENVVPSVVVFHAGTALDSDGNLIAVGGRVLGVTAKGRDLREAQERAYQGVEQINWPGGFYRRDIGWRALALLKDNFVTAGLLMASVSSQPQFRYTQPPSKVLHLRNLPWECTEEELIELGKPFGQVVNTKCNVGANRNQAFIEFAELNQAITMISYYASSSEPAQVRGKTVYLQYSNRQEIVNNKTAADVAGNVLLVTIEGEDARLVSIDVLHLVFSAFGFVHKITTFEKTAGFQALVQFSDAQIATDAKNSLDGRNIPSYLLPENLGPCSLRITYSGHTDLSVKFQSHRSRDYTNPYLPVAPSAIDGNGQISVGLDGKKQEPESNVLLASIENMQYAVTLDVLHMVFSAFGPVQKIAMFDKNGGVQALIQYPDVQTAVVAREALEGHCIYDGGFCKLHVSYSRHTDLSIKVNNDRSRDYTIPNVPMVNSQPSILGQQPGHMMNPAAPQYSGAQYAPAGQAMMPQPSAGWGPTVPAVPPQSMPMQMPNQPYMPAGTVPSQMGPGMMPGGAQHPNVPPYHNGHVQ